MKTQSETEKKISPKPVRKMSFLRKMLSMLPWFCSYCGKMYIGCHSKDINILFPMPQNGKCCPDGHEGYVTSFNGYAEIKTIFDFVENPPLE